MSVSIHIFTSIHNSRSRRRKINLSTKYYDEYVYMFLIFYIILHAMCILCIFAPSNFSQMHKNPRFVDYNKIKRLILLIARLILISKLKIIISNLTTRQNMHNIQKRVY